MSEAYSDDFDELSTPTDTHSPSAHPATNNAARAPLNADDLSSFHGSSARASLSTTATSSLAHSPHGRSQSPTHPVRAKSDLIAHSPRGGVPTHSLSSGSPGSMKPAYPTQGRASTSHHEGAANGGGVHLPSSLPRTSISKQDVTAERLAACGADVRHAMHVSKFTTVQRLDESDKKAARATTDELSSEDDDDKKKGKRKGKRSDDPWRELGDSEDASSVGEDDHAAKSQGPSTRAAPATQPGSAGGRGHSDHSEKSNGDAKATELENGSTANEPQRVLPLSLQEPGKAAGRQQSAYRAEYQSYRSSSADSMNERPSEVLQSANRAKSDGTAGKGKETVESSCASSSSPSSSASSSHASPAKGHSVPARASSHSGSRSGSSSSRRTSSSRSSRRRASDHPGSLPPLLSKPAGARPTEDAATSNSISTSASVAHKRRKVNAAAGCAFAYDRFNGAYPAPGDSDEEDGSTVLSPAHSRAPPTAGNASKTSEVEEIGKAREDLIAHCVALQREIEEWNNRIALQEHEEELLRQRQQQQAQRARGGGGGGVGKPTAEERAKRIARLRRENNEMEAEVASYEGNEIMSVAFLVARAQKQLIAAKARLAEAKKVKRSLASRDKRAAHTIEEVHRRQPDATELEQRQVNEGLYSLASLERQRRDLKKRIKQSEVAHAIMQKQCEQLEKEVRARQCADITPKEFEALQERYAQAQQSAERAKTAIDVYTNAINQGRAGNAAANTPRHRGTRAMSEVNGGTDDMAADLLDAYARQRQALEAEKADLLEKIQQREAIIAANTGGEVYTKARQLPSVAHAEAKRKGTKSKGVVGGGGGGPRARTPQSRRASRRPSVMENSRVPSSAQPKLTGASPSTRVGAKAGGAVGSRRVSAGGRAERGVATQPPTDVAAHHRSSSGAGRVNANARKPRAGLSPQKQKRHPFTSSAVAAQPSSKDTPKSTSQQLAPAPDDLAVSALDDQMPPSTTSAVDGYTPKREDSLDDVLKAIDADNARLLQGLGKPTTALSVSSSAAGPEPAVGGGAAIAARQHPFLSKEPVLPSAVDDDGVDDIFGPTSLAPADLARKADAALGGDGVVEEAIMNPAPEVNNDDDDDSGRETPPWLR